MKYMRLYASPDGESHLEDVEIESGGGGPASDSILVAGISFIWQPAGFFADWHCAQRRMLMVNLAGSSDDVTSDGSRATVSTGTVVLVEDLTGKGHQTIVDKSADRILMAVWLSGQDAVAAAAAPARPAAPPSADKHVLRIPRLYTTPDGGTTFDEIEVDLGGQGTASPQGLRLDSVRFVRLPAGTFNDWHTEPRRAFVVTLSGEADLVTTDGARRHVAAGTVMLVEDLTGKGHQTIVGGSADRTLMTIPAY